MNGFIIGTGRCGTTMLASLLDTHSQICVPPETQLLFQYRGNGVGLHEIFATGAQWNANADDFIEFVEARCPHDFGRYFDYVGYFSARQYLVATLDALMASFYSEIATAKGKRVCIEQTPWYGLGIDILGCIRMGAFATVGMSPFRMRGRRGGRRTSAQIWRAGLSRAI